MSKTEHLAGHNTSNYYSDLFKIWWHNKTFFKIVLNIMRDIHITKIWQLFWYSSMKISKNKNTRNVLSFVLPEPQMVPSNWSYFNKTPRRGLSIINFWQCQPFRLTDWRRLEQTKLISLSLFLSFIAFPSQREPSINISLFYRCQSLNNNHIILLNDISGIILEPNSLKIE